MRPFEARYRIPSTLPQRGAWPPPADLAHRYSLPSQEVDIAAMLGEFQNGIEGRCQTLSQRLQESSVWGEGMSLRSIPNAEKHFEPFTGAIQLQIIPPGYDTFYYDVPGRTHNRGNGTREVRGARFYANVDAARNTPADKNAVMVADWQAAVDTLHSVPPLSPGDTDAFFARVGILDYMKQHALTAFHALTYPERLGKQMDVPNYEELRRRAFNLARDSVRSYYLTLLGREDVPVEDFDRRLKDFTEITDVLTAQATHKYYKAAEIDHPVTLLTNADATADSHKDTDVIVSLPSGGTQMGFAIELAMELKNGKRPHVIALPLSNHSHIQTLTDRATCEELEKRLVAEGVAEKKVLVADDNSNSGNSIQTTVDLLGRAGAADVAVSLAELDPMRIIYKHSQEEQPETVAHMMHPDYDSVAGIVPITRGNELPLQVRKMYAQHLLRRHYEESQPVLGVEITPHPYERSVLGRRPYLITSSENKARAGHRFGLRVFNGDSKAVDEAEQAYDEAHHTTEGVITADQAGEYMRGVALAKLEGVCSFIAEQGENLATKDAYAYAREAAIPPSVMITDTNLLLGDTLLKKPGTPVAAENILHAYEEARSMQSEVKYVTHVGRLDLTLTDGPQRSMYQVSVTLGTVRPDADLTKVKELLQTKPDRVGGIGSYRELMDILTPQPLVLEVTKWSEDQEKEGEFQMTDRTRHIVPPEQVTPDLLSMLTRGFVPNR